MIQDALIWSLEFENEERDKKKEKIYLLFEYIEVEVQKIFLIVIFVMIGIFDRKIKTKEFKCNFASVLLNFICEPVFSQ